MAKLPAKIEDRRKEIVEKVAQDMETMGGAWLRPWASLGMPRNPVTGSEYHGSNALYLLAVAAWKGYGDPRWATFNQAKKNGWKLRKGSKAVAVEHWRSVVKDLTDSEGNPALEREQKGRFGDSDYAFEELVAELASLFASCELGVPVELDESDEHYARHVAYLKSWSKGIKEDPDALFKAAAAAGKAATYNVERWSESTGKRPAAAKAVALPESA